MGTLKAVYTVRICLLQRRQTVMPVPMATIMTMKRLSTVNLWWDAMELDHGSASRLRKIKVPSPWLTLVCNIRQLGLELQGDSSNVYWGAFDAIIKSDVRSPADMQVALWGLTSVNLSYPLCG